MGGLLLTGTSKSHQRAQVDSILKLPVLFPHQTLAEVFDAAAEPALEKALACRRESRTLAALRDALLPKLIWARFG
ncbi:MAG: hypothetical protein RMH97_03470 [Verrucomicrobiales bacterium]|nr:hypothetical protein [Verrucomicrobiales bacterium]